MSMYDMIFKPDLTYEASLLFLLGNPEVGRYRDAWVERGQEGGPVIAIYTRNGGGNRECHCPSLGHEHPGPNGDCLAHIIEGLRAHSHYLRDENDEFDRTYATFYFRCPDGAVELLTPLMVEHFVTSERWLDAIDAIRKAAT